MTLTTEARAPSIPRTSIGKKVLVAATGLIGLGFVFGHMVGNLKVFLGPSHIDEYGEFLRDVGEPMFPRSSILWGVRIVLITAVVLHIVLTVQLAMQSRRARPDRYDTTRTVDATYASRTMRWGGLTIVGFLVFHLADFTWGTVNPGFERGAVYRNVVAGFERPLVTIAYIAAMVALCMHVYHGTWSVTQTLGIRTERSDRVIRRTALTLAAVLFVGFVSVPLAVMAGIVE